MMQLTEQVAKTVSVTQACEALHATRNHYLTPLAGWVAQALTGRTRLTPIRAADGQTVGRRLRIQPPPDG